DKFTSLHKIQLDNNQCNLTFHFKYWRSDTQDILASTSQYLWKCPDKIKTKIIIKNGTPEMGINTGFQGNIWNDPSK
ncbi:hypothetical protein KKF84_10400, partial [Myxococcota bacterium]|nr:hypothetical protein [Myxococcota bacterium]MBU1535721.1 hypothetical protein [Myxococcota bacterium]